MKSTLAETCQKHRNHLFKKALTGLLLASFAGIPSSAPAQVDSTRVATGLVTLYDFASGSGGVVHDVSGVGSPLDLIIPDTTAVAWVPGGGLDLVSPTLVSSESPATKIFDAVGATNAITVEAWLIPASTDQSGPARILTCSDSATARNFTLGQGVYNAGTDRYVMRMRTTSTDGNGIPETATPVGSLTTDLTHVVYTRNATGTVTVYMGGGLAQTDFTGGTMANWDATYPLALGDELIGGRPWLGSFHLLAIYDRALSLAEVIQNFNAGPSGEIIPTAPVIRSEPVTLGAVVQDYTYMVLASGYPAPSFALVDPPAGMTIDPVSGLISWVPSATGDYDVEIAAANSEGSDTQTFTLSVYPDYPLKIEVWHGLDQRVGHLGFLQTDFNVLGNVSPVADIASLAYNLNGGLYQDLTTGPNSRRLANPGDFNADIPVSLLLPGANTITLRAIGTTGLVATVDVTITRETDGSQNLPVSIVWDEVIDPQDEGQYVDGKWGSEPDGLRTLETGYDRIFLIGDSSWQDYEVLVPFTINAVDVAGAGLGLLMRFTGHVIGGHRDWPYAQPKWGYQPFGGIGWLRWDLGPDSPPRIQFYRGFDDLEINNGTLPVTPGGTYWMRMRCETQDDAPTGEGITLYSFKIWEDTTSEPADWSHQVLQQSLHALRQGGVGLLAHHVDATFGDVVVVDLSGPVSSVDNLALPRIALSQNHPNPFNPTTIINMDIAQESPVRLVIFDIRGRKVRDLFTGTLSQGLHAFRWDGRDDKGRDAAGGIYLLRLDSAGYADTKKMTLVR